MPNYIEDVTAAGWVEKGKFWINEKFPDKKYWTAIQVYESEDFPGKRPTTIAVKPLPAPEIAAPIKPAIPTAEEIAAVTAAEKIGAGVKAASAALPKPALEGAEVPEEVEPRAPIPKRSK